MINAATSQIAVNEFSWSNTKYQIFQECLRKYYYHYYDWREARTIPQECRKRTSSVMRALQSRSSWIGTVVHEVIAVVINNLLLFNGQYSFDQADEILVRKMKNDWRNSLDWLITEDTKAFCGLEEHFYNMDYCDYNGYQEDLKTARAHIKALFESGLLKEIMREDVKIIEFESGTAFLWDGIKINQRIDLALMDSGGNVSITDWKTGRPPKAANDLSIGVTDEDDNLQLNLYAKYISIKYKAPYDRIHTQQIYLADKKQIPFKITAESIKATQDIVRESSQKMLALLDDPVQNQASIKNFPKTNDTEHCKYCNFRGLCQPQSFTYPRHWRKEQRVPFYSGTLKGNGISQKSKIEEVNLQALSIQEIVEQRNIISLFHFTHIKNLESILKYGLLSRIKVEGLPERPDLIVNDNLRLDGHPETISLSIGFPNYKMFSVYSKNPEEWVVIELKREVLWELDCKFFVENAAKKDARNVSLEKLFQDFNSIHRNDLSIPDGYPTNPQAEVLVFSPIPPKYFLNVYFCNPHSLSTWVNDHGNGHKDLFVVKPGYFSWRCDYEFW